jgi:hypothetical protein
MQEQMDRIRQTKDPKTREKLLQEHMQTMQKQMQDMRGMGGETMMEAMGQKGGHGMGSESGMDPEARQRMMQDRMDMMQMMMEQMMNQLQVMQGKVHGKMHGQ